MSNDVKLNFSANGIADVQRAFETLEKRISKFELEATKRVSREEKERSKIAEREAKKREQLTRNAWQAANKIAAQRTRAEAREAALAVKAVESAEREKTRAVERESRKREAVAKRAARTEIQEAARVARSREQFARSVSGRVTGAIGNATRNVVNYGAAALTIGGGAVIADSVKNSMAFEAAAVQLAHSAYNPTDKSARRRDPSEFVGNIKAIQAATNIDKLEVAKGLQKYIALSSDASVLDKGSTMGMDLAKIAKARGTSFEALAAVAGNLRVQNKNLTGEGVIDILRKTIGQGGAGAVELEDLVQYAGEVTSSAGQYAGDQATNQSKLLGLAQLARRVTGTADSATAVNRFTSDIAANREKIEAAGIKVSQVDKFGRRQLIGQEDILANFMEKTLGDTGALKHLGIGRESVKVFNAAQATFNEAFNASKASTKEGKAKEAAAAVRAEAAALMGANYSKENIDTDFREVMKTSGERFDAVIIKLKEIVADKLGPHIETFISKLADKTPDIVRAIDAIGKWGDKLADWLASASDNPLKAIGEIILALVVKDLAMAAIGAGVTKALTMGIQAATPGLVSLLGAAGPIGLAVAAFAAAIGAAAYMIKSRADEARDFKAAVRTSIGEGTHFANRMEIGAQQGLITRSEQEQAGVIRSDLETKLLTADAEDKKDLRIAIEKLAVAIEHAQDPSASKPLVRYGPDPSLMPSKSSANHPARQGTMIPTRP